MHIDSCLLASLAFVPSAFGQIRYLGVAIPGIDFGCDIDGSCPLDTVNLPLAEFGGGDGAGQMKHFVEDDGMNIFRLPSSWQFLVNNELGKLDSTNFGQYEKLVQACLDTGAYCMIDLHNFARYDGGIIGQGGPTDDDFVDFWRQIAHKYAKEDKIVFGLMNEPHDLDINLWAKSCQKAVTAIRKAGASSQIILLPGTNFASAASFVSTESAAALSAITNPDGSTDNLVLDLHQYLDINNSGTHEECTTDNVEGFGTISTWLRKNKRKAIISESGASMDPTCMEKFCTQNEFISSNSDVFIGFVAWGAGSFTSSYVLTLTPEGSDGSYTDNELMKKCILAPFIEDAEPATASASKTSTSHSTSTQRSATSTDQILKEGTDEESSSSTPATSSASAATSSDSSSSHLRYLEPFTGGLVLAALALFHI